MSALESRNIEKPHETRPYRAHGHMDVVTLGDFTIGKGTFEPGWKWSEDVKPIAGTDSCQVLHTGYVLSGTMQIRMDDGTVDEKDRTYVWRVLAVNETVTVPAGTFNNAIKVQRDRPDKEGKERFYWLVPGIGKAAPTRGNKLTFQPVSISGARKSARSRRKLMPISANNAVPSSSTAQNAPVNRIASASWAPWRQPRSK